MRAELRPPAFDDDLTDHLGAAYARLETGSPPAEVAEQLSAAAGYVIEPAWLHGVFGSTPPAEAAWQLRVHADPSLVRRAIPTREELVEVVRRLMPTSLDWDADAAPWWAALLSAHTPHPEPLDLIFFPPADVDPACWSAEDIVERALAYRPIAL